MDGMEDRHLLLFAQQDDHAHQHDALLLAVEHPVPRPLRRALRERLRGSGG